MSFKELVDKFKHIKDEDNEPCLYYLLGNRELSTELIKINRLNQDDLRYLLNRIDNRSELHNLCCNTSLTKYVLNEFILNTEIVDRFNTIIENDEWCKDYNIHTIFDRIEYGNEDNEEILELNDLNRKVYRLSDFNLTTDQKLELIELLKDNEIAQSRLNYIVENHLESNYDFESLMRYLKKVEKKNILNI